MDKPNIYSAGDYAGIETKNLKFYYGYEQIDEDSEEWCFVASKNGKEVMRIKNSVLLDIADGDSPNDMLLAGIALYLSK